MSGLRKFTIACTATWLLAPSTVHASDPIAGVGITPPSAQTSGTDWSLKPQDSVPSPAAVDTRVEDGDINLVSCCEQAGCGDAYCGDACGCGCDSGFDLSSGLCGGGCLGEPYRLADEMCCPITVGGWLSAGYHSDNTRQSFAFNDLFAYNDVPDQLNLHQAWVYLEKATNSRRYNSADYGFRTDIVYGTDAQSLQANGSARAAENRNRGNWDASFDHGEYGWAIPQAYGEIAYNDWKVKAGYFLSLIGYESSLAPANFFYSHSLTMFNSEPFTHTGVIAENNAIDGLTLYGGWVMGWDAAWEQELGGSAFLGGFSAELSRDANFTYMLNVGDFGYRGDDGYNHSLVLELALTDSLEYAVQSDYFKADNFFAVPGDTIEEFGIVQYLYYSLSERVALGGRVEWWNSNGPTDTSQSYYEITGGVNFQPNANLVIRPEIRYDWTPGDSNFAAATGEDYNNTVFGIDAVLTY